MTDQNQDEDERAFFDRADSFIRLANDHCDRVEAGRVSASFMFALARFNAFVCAGTCKSAEEMKGDRKRALDYFTAQFRKMLGDNFDDYVEHFDQYTGSDPSPDDPGSNGDAGEASE